MSWTENAPAGAEGRLALPGLAHFAHPLEPLEGTLPGVPSDVPPSGGNGGNVPQGGKPAMIFRSPAPAPAQDAAPREQEGESILAAQAVSPERARSMNRAFSYSAPGPVGSDGSGALPERRGQSAGQGAEEINYNRLTEEILVRIERRLRAERRKFGL